MRMKTKKGSKTRRRNVNEGKMILLQGERRLLLDEKDKRLRWRRGGHLYWEGKKWIVLSLLLQQKVTTYQIKNLEVTI